GGAALPSGPRRPHSRFRRDAPAGSANWRVASGSDAEESAGGLRESDARGRPQLPGLSRAHGRRPAGRHVRLSFREPSRKCGALTPRVRVHDAARRRGTPVTAGQMRAPIVAAFCALLVLTAGCATSLLNQAHQAEQLAEYDLAIARYSRVLRDDPDNVAARQGLERARLRAAD